MNLCCQRSTASASLRVSVGVAVAIVGLVHYVQLGDFTGAVSNGLGPISGLGVLWAYILPALEIIGGLWFAFDQKNPLPALILGVAFASIAIGMVAKSVISDDMALSTTMPAAQNAMLWLLFVLAASLTSAKHDAHIHE